MNPIDKIKKLECALAKCKKNKNNSIIQGITMNITQVGFNSSNDGFIFTLVDQNGNHVSGIQLPDIYVYDLNNAETFQYDVAPILVENGNTYELHGGTFTASYFVSITGTQANDTFQTGV